MGRQGPRIRTCPPGVRRPGMGERFPPLDAVKGWYLLMWRERTKRWISLSQQSMPVSMASMPVSYTHLDVYKRQELVSIITIIKSHSARTSNDMDINI